MADLLRVCCQPCDLPPLSRIMSRLMEGQGDRRDLLFFVFHEGPAAIAIGDAPGQVYSLPLYRSVKGRRIVAGFDPFDVDDYEILWAGFDRVRYQTSPDSRTRWTPGVQGFHVDFTILDDDGPTPPRPSWDARRPRPG